MKQTAVEWLHEQLLKILIDNQIQQTDYLFEQAKAMEKEQMIDFARLCLNKAKDLDILSAFMNVQQYYNETYGGKDEL
jgi:hypothetical protein